ncbi:MAG TPA: hypothetical protein VHG28_19840 [Longimicrobiaceae bacterium]|nr:hypothetical protein [Longimicrobiaceae bacterium]
MPHPHPYDREHRPRGYDRGYAGPRHEPLRYDRDFRGGYDAEPGFPAGWGYLPAGWGGYPGLEAFGAGPWPPYLPYGYPYGPPELYTRPPRRPEESPAYGRGGDHEMLRWAREHGYEVERTIHPRRPRRY